jgi:predicted metal-binding membrane protein
MSHVQMLSTVGLIRTSRRRGFCPACRLFQTGDGPQEISAPALIALAFVIVAAAAWALTIARMSSMDDMPMGLGAIGPFAAAWTLMMVAMMFPSAMPLIFEFARNAERRRGWRLATAVLAVTYLGVWLAFGGLSYLLYNALGMPWPNQAVVGGAALVVAGVYALTPLKRASEARCRELCALHGPLPFNLMHSAILAGGRYGLSCLGCSAGLMVAMVLIGLSNLTWMIGLTAVLCIYKLAPAPTLRWASALSAAVVALGVLYAATAVTP